MRRVVAALGLLLVWFVAIRTVASEKVRIEAGRDAVLIEDPDGALANGAGAAILAGRTNQIEDGVRRALVWFDLSALPPGAIVESASLVLHQLSGGNAEPRTVRPHRALAPWCEGPSVGPGGQGAPAGSGDATWLHACRDQRFWAYSGAQFEGVESASVEVAGEGAYFWESSRMLRDVRLWMSAPRMNFGWILIGDETTRKTTKSFAARENPDPSLRPFLEIVFRAPGRP